MLARLLWTALLALGASPVFAQADVRVKPSSETPGLIEEYSAYIGRDDLYNSSGTRLGSPWQVLRQDRANFHQFKIRQPGDQGDGFFSSKANRASFERMLRQGQISPAAGRMIMKGDVLVHVQIWGEGDTGTYVRVEVE